MFLPGNAFNGDDVESIVYIMEAIAASILASDSADLALLVAMHRLFRSAASVICPGLHFDERERLAIPTDEIHFAKALSIVACDDLVALLTEIAISDEFSRQSLSPVEEPSRIGAFIRRVAVLQSRAETGVKACSALPKTLEFNRAAL